MSTYQWTRRERRRFGKRLPHPYSVKGRLEARRSEKDGTLRNGRPYFVTPERQRPKVSKWLRPELRCH